MDFGTLNTVIAVARNRGVDVVCIPLLSNAASVVLANAIQITNEVSNRATP